MAAFVFIHGAWHGGWCFDPVAERLRALGHVVDCPTLPGMGGSEAELRAVTLDGWADFAIERCKAMRLQTDGPVILAGHSRGGLVISQAAERDPQAMDGLAYICAMMLPNGITRADFKDMQEPNPDFDAIISVLPHGAGTVVDPAKAPAVFAQLSPPDLVSAAMPRLLAEPTSPRDTTIIVSDERWGSLPRTYIECSQDRTIPLSSQRLMQEMCPGARVVSLACDHSPFLSAPDELAQALLGCL